MNLEQYKEYVSNRQKWIKGEIKAITDISLTMDDETIAECEKLYNQKKSIKKRAIKHVLAYESPFIYFVTITFGAMLEKTTKDYRRKYVSRLMKKLNISEYIGCIDYGEQNGREHYHFVVGSKDAFPNLVRILKQGKSYVLCYDTLESAQVQDTSVNHECIQENSILFKRVDNFKQSSNKIVKYLIKVIYYTIKSDEKIIYSRGLDKEPIKSSMSEKTYKHQCSKIIKLTKKLNIKSIGYKPKTLIDVQELKARIKAVEDTIES